jgi:hypothetical protein
LLLFIVIGCEQDDAISYNHFKINDKVYKIEMCSIFKYPESDSTNYLWFNFYDDQIEISLTDTGFFASQFTGGLNCISFQNASFSNKIKNGKYSIGSHNSGGYGYDAYGYLPSSVGQFYYGEVGLDFNKSNENFDKKIWINSGSLVLDTDGLNYTIEFNCIGFDGSIIYGYFNGRPTEFLQSREQENPFS